MCKEKSGCNPPPAIGTTNGNAMKAGKPLINGAHLEAIRQALGLMAPGLSRHVRTIVLQGPVPERSAKPGQPAFRSYVFNLKAGDAKAVLSELERAKMIYGDQFEFCGFPVSVLVMAWNGQLTKKRKAGMRTKNRNQRR
jgi:hypothetical protein